MAAFYSVARRNGRNCFLTPQDRPFFSIGMNHIDPATICYPESSDVWHIALGNSMERFAQQVRADLLDWGFNTIGWVQEMVIICESYHRHSRNFTYEEYQWADMPYCHMLPFTDTHQWEIEVRLPDITSPDFEEWCDYVARAHCVRFRDDPNLIGYFYSDCPVWVHTRRDNAWRGSLFDPARLASQAGRDELYTLAQRYYQVTHDAIRRYDPHHLILGDRYEANAPLPEEVVRAALPTVDVLSFQCFGTPQSIEDKLRAWVELSGKPVLLADAAGWLQPHTPGWPPTENRMQDAAHYREVMERLWGITQCVGYHLCGAYLRNRARRYGFRDETNGPIQHTIDGIRQVNAEVAGRAQRLWGG